ncbi:TMV resistance protein N-like [Eucalyptus grandis]|uniref:TMV resistance protein N-like n=1 Tax=Eucalyptus grandis TaxID=71139 RepID=UPI00192ECDC4|nr:TMV resistance protein N-like [Eucalyptus grandis]
MLPIFYDVKSDDVKLKTALYSEAISNLKQQKKNKFSPEEVKKWRRALREVNDTKHGELVKLFVDEVMYKLKSRQRKVTDDLVGIDDQLLAINTLLDLNSGGMQLVGIHGMGGLVKLQEQLLYDIVNSRVARNIDITDYGMNAIGEILGNKKVLIVLDDIDESEQIEDLSGKDSLHAFGRDSPPNPYYSRSKEIVSTPGGSPLALQIFLDIACFLINEKKINPIYVWKDCDFSPKHSIDVLINVSMIKVLDDSKIWMHDQCRDLGRAIVRQEILEHPIKRSRVWNDDDALNILRSTELKHAFYRQILICFGIIGEAFGRRMLFYEEASRFIELEEPEGLRIRESRSHRSSRASMNGDDVLQARDIQGASSTFLKLYALDIALSPVLFILKHKTGRSLGRSF